MVPASIKAIEIIDYNLVNIFHCGCVIAEIRDYRQSGNMKSPGYQSRHILLRPTMQTLICDVHSITSDNHKWTQEDKLLLESQLILATAEPLCLDPSIAVTCTANRLLYNKQKMNTRPMKRCFKRYSRSSQNRQQDVSHSTAPPQLRLLDYLQKKKKREKQPSSRTSKFLSRKLCGYVETEPLLFDYTFRSGYFYSLLYNPVFCWFDVLGGKEIKEDYVFECEVGNQFQKTKLTIFQSLGNPLYYGKIQTYRSDEETERPMSPTQFLIGSKTDAERPESLLIQPSVLGKGVKHRPPPIKLPSSSGSSSSGSGTPKPSNSYTNPFIDPHTLLMLRAQLLLPLVPPLLPKIQASPLSPLYPVCSSSKCL
ncbi:transcription factor SPT20 homolog [Dromiciops gliroides]|uniref:transcription factor SPT20 homolog n=1 Tax=Dromiciops gliroides TaxID=33562 RepID=UPI001CC51B6F|nr:transcription factor SPT20 homolog [Dromiciops gliroides]